MNLKGIKKAANSAIKTVKNEAKYIKENNTNLEGQRKILKRNIKWEKNMVKNNKSYKNPYNGKTYGPDHYKKAIKYDQKDLARLNTKIALKNAAKKAYKSTPIGKLNKAYKVTKAGLINFLKKKKK